MDSDQNSNGKPGQDFKKKYGNVGILQCPVRAIKEQDVPGRDRFENRIISGFERSTVDRIAKVIDFGAWIRINRNHFCFQIAVLDAAAHELC